MESKIAKVEGKTTKPVDKLVKLEGKSSKVEGIPNSGSKRHHPNFVESYPLPILLL
ncbi:hypothetical protein [Bacillus sp. MUM 116]|uniref:hypothetical protein n=1 Tax=Bacillus sp. MUM 116 TaxID=1678002 RepID=UPI0015A59B49|nr:hypothetical protein [Bacillus sp. MUM 116]